MRIENIRIGARLTIAFSLSTVLLAIVVAVGAGALQHVKSEIEMTSGDRYLKIKMLHEVKDALNQQARSIRNSLLMADVKDIDTELEAAIQNGKAASTVMDKLGGLLANPEGKRLFQVAQSAAQEIRATPTPPQCL